MQALAAHGRSPKRRRSWMVAVVLVALAAGAGGAVFAVRRGDGSGGAGGGGASSARGTASSAGGADAFKVVSTTPGAHADGVATNAVVRVRFSQPVAAGGPMPTLDPPVAGRWLAVHGRTLVFDASAPLVPGSPESLTIPGGPSGVRDQAGGHLAATRTVPFTVATGSTLRLQELLAQLGYLPLAYVPPDPPPAPSDMAEPQPGALTWRWTMPSSLTTLWSTATPSVITKGAVMNFENQNGLTVDGIAGPKVWATLLTDVADGKGDTVPYTYVLVTKTLPEHLTVYDDGTVKYSDVPVNTGAPGATTPVGTFEVFEHVVASDMKGTNITGSTYNDPTVPWASYFHTGDALHGFVRAQYGFPQSNGCVEMPIAEAALVWPLTPIGTLVTVAGTSG
jgi:peptidoglycan hydrolase-like protein with peptidoglycan-binding domain